MEREARALCAQTLEGEEHQLALDGTRKCVREGHAARARSTALAIVHAHAWRRVPWRSAL